MVDTKRGSSDHFRTRALIVDDDPAIRLLIARVLERADVFVDSAADGEEALRKLETNGDYSVVLLDLMMPRKSGFDVLEALKRNHPEALKGVIVISAIGRPLRESDRAVVCGIVAKPFDLKQLTDAVQNCVNDAAEPG